MLFEGLLYKSTNSYEMKIHLRPASRLSSYWEHWKSSNYPDFSFKRRPNPCSNRFRFLDNIPLKRNFRLTMFHLAASTVQPLNVRIFRHKFCTSKNVLATFKNSMNKRLNIF